MYRILFAFYSLYCDITLAYTMLVSATLHIKHECATIYGGTVCFGLTLTSNSSFKKLEIALRIVW